jgi:hypothetical protein
MPALIALILILGITMMLFGAIDKQSLPPELAGLAGDGAQAPLASAAPGTAGFGTPEAPLWQDGWKLFQEHGVLYVSAELGGRYRAYAPPQVYLACEPGGKLAAMLDTRLPLQVDKLKVRTTDYSMSPSARTWYRIPDKALKPMLDAEAVSLNFEGADWAAFTLPNNTRVMAATLLGACARAERARGAGAA